MHKEEDRLSNKNYRWGVQMLRPIFLKYKGGFILESIDLKNKMLVYSSILFIGVFFIITLTAIGFYGFKINEIEAKNNNIIVSKDKQIKELQNQNQLLQQEISALKSKKK
jgi:hypothetical protein